MLMPASPRSKSPRDDEINTALELLAETQLDDYFLDDENVDRFQRLARGGRGTTLGEIAELGAAEFSGRGELAMTMRVGSPEITLSFLHPKFSATVVATYDINQAAMIEGRVVELTGDRKQAFRLAEKWFEELNDSLLDDEMDFDQLLSALDAGQPFANESDPGEPPPPTDADRAAVESLARRLAPEMRRKKPNIAAHVDELEALEHSPQSLWPILDGMIAACEAAKRDDAVLNAWLFLLQSQLAQIRFRTEAGWPWAERMVEDYQQKLLRLGAEHRVRPEDFTAMVNALGEAGIEVKPEIRTAFADVGLTMPNPPRSAELSGMLGGLMDEMARSVSDPFETVAALDQATRVMPAELRCFMAHEFALSAHAVLRDSVPLFLLAPDREVRRSAAAALEQTAIPEQMSPVALRRMIAVRNWVPEFDRAAIDQAIREARTRSVECAPWPAARDLTVTASMIDGSGAQSVLLTNDAGKQRILAGVLIKQAAGVADAWGDQGVSRRDLNDALATLRRSGPTSEVDRSWFDVAIQHAIAKGVSAGQPPDVSLLWIAEAAGGSDWRDRLLNVTDEAKSLFEALPAEQRSASAVQKSLGRSGAWHRENFAASWFLEGEEVRTAIRAASGDRVAAERRLVEDVMPVRRAEWTERFLLLAMRARAAKVQGQRALADDFVILAHELSKGGPLASVPLMVEIARHTIDVSRMARW
jgi:hypothetical protein